MKEVLKYIFVAVGVIGAILLIYFGAYLPFQKSQRYITAIRNVPQIRTTADFHKEFDVPFSYVSPIGDEEITKFLSSDVLNMIQKNQPEEVARDLVSYVDQHLSRYSYDLRLELLRGHLYETLWRNYRHGDDYLKAESIYLHAVQLGPRVPRALYVAFNLYVTSQDPRGLREIGEKILSLWPEDVRVKEVVDSISS